MKIYLLAHSGVAIECADRVLVIDAWQDPERHLEKLATGGKDLYFMVTHAHGDHYAPAFLAKYADRAKGFLLEEECRPCPLPETKTIFTRPGEVTKWFDMTVRTFGSTDSGGCFHVTMPEVTIFHAGDLNWWHWTGDTDSANEEMRRMFFRELEPVVEYPCDVAFFAVDDRQGPAQEWGLIEYLHRQEPSLVVPIHRNGTPWRPSLYFQWRFRDIPVWTGLVDGDSCEWEKE